MDEYHLDYEQARALQTPGLRRWLLQAKRQNTVLEIIPHNEFLDMTARAHGLKYSDMKKIYEAVCKNTHDGAEQRIIARHDSTLFAKRYGKEGKVRPTRHKRERDELENEYQSNKRRVGH
jgi:hypothetical protein